MISQRRVVDGIQHFSPSKEMWVDKTTENLPDKVTVSFRRGQTGILDMQSPRIAFWAKLIEERQRNNQPVYVEIDEETNVITNMLLPSYYTVDKMETDEHGDLRVLFQPSSAVHYLLQSDPNFSAMQEKLQTALDNSTELWVTETRDEHEIIDIRVPSDPSGDPSDPSPVPPEDPPVSEARAMELYNNMNAESCNPCSPSADCIPFLYPDDGCWIRAHIMCHMMRDGGPDMTANPSEDPEKVWIHGWLTAPTANHPDCHVNWGWHVAPTVMTNLSGGGTEKQVIDPSLTPSPEALALWKNRQGDPSATLTETDWTNYNWVGDTTSVSLAQSHVHMQTYRNRLQQRCLDFGPPPYNCVRNCFFIIDRNTFSDDEIEAMLSVSSPAEIEDAFYIVADGFSPHELGFTNATMQVTPTTNITPSVSGMTFSADRLVFEYPTHLNRRQRLTWVYKISFASTTDFTTERKTLTINATVSTKSSAGLFYLIQQPNPYEIDGAVSWLSTDLRTFQIKTGQSKFNVAMGSNPSAFITQAISNLNSGSAGGQTFENDISTDQQTSQLELSPTQNGTAVYNFAIAKVRYRALSTSATDVRVFFRLFPVATTSLAYDQAITYRRHESGATIVPLLGIKNNEVAAIPCFASPRINSATSSITTQTDPANITTIPPNPGGAEVIRYFGCWLDINQTTPQFPITPSPIDGPYTSGRISIQDHVRNEHQCLVSEIAFTPAPAQNGSTPSVSDKLAQRNLAIVESANPGLASSRRIPQTFEVRPSTSTLENDELMIDWGNVPQGSVASIYIPGIDVDDILLLAAKIYRSHRFVRLDKHTLKCETGGITYIPIPFTDGSYPGMLTIDLPEGVTKGDVFKVVVKQVTGEIPKAATTRLATVPKSTWRHIVGAFQLTIPVREKGDMLPGQMKTLSIMRWIQRAIPLQNRWYPVFGRYVLQMAERVDALGGDATKVAPSPSGQWKEAYVRCLSLFILLILLIAAFLVGVGTLSGGLVAMTGTLLCAFLVAAYTHWIKTCRPRICRVLKTILFGTGLGALVLVVLALAGHGTKQLFATLSVGVIVAVLTSIVSIVKGCFKAPQI